MLDALLEGGADPTIMGSSGLAPPEAAARSSNDFAIKRLIEFGSNPNKIPPSGQTPLFFAIQEQCEECVRALLSKGANVNVRFKGDWTPLLRAVETGNIDILKLLRAAEARVVDVCMPGKWSPLRIAAKEGHRVAVSGCLNKVWTREERTRKARLLWSLLKLLAIKPSYLFLGKHREIIIHVVEFPLESGVK